MKVNGKRIELEVGDKLQLEMPYSEVMMHMKLAGKVCYIEVGRTSVRILGDDGRPNTGSVTHGEAGLYSSTEPEQWYVYTDKVPWWARDPEESAALTVRLMVCTRCQAGRTDVPNTPDMYPSNLGLATIHTDDRPPYSSEYPKGLVYVTPHKRDCGVLGRTLNDPKVEVN